MLQGSLISSRRPMSLSWHSCARCVQRILCGSSIRDLELTFEYHPQMIPSHSLFKQISVRHPKQGIVQRIEENEIAKKTGVWISFDLKRSSSSHSRKGIRERAGHCIVSADGKYRCATTPSRPPVISIKSGGVQSAFCLAVFLSSVCSSFL